MTTKLVSSFLTIFILHLISIINLYQVSTNINDAEKYKLINDDVFKQISKELYNKIKIFCIVLTKPEHRIIRVNALKTTWLKRCNKYKYIVTGKIRKSKKGKRQTVYFPIKNILLTTIKELYKEHTSDIHWFLIVDDTSYVVMENLRYMLYPYNPNETLSVGFDIKSSPYIKSTGTLLSHGSYLLSIAALQKFVTEVLPNIEDCSTKEGNDDDFEISKCLSQINVQHIDSKDDFGYDKIIKSSLVPNSERCEFVDSEVFQALGRTLSSKPTYAEYPISFHNIRQDAQYAMEYFLYHASIIGKQSSFFKNVYEKFFTNEELEKIAIEEIMHLAPLYVMEKEK
uniref:N-acetylgalactosaminide beta-1,3-galactosyltransferase n=1 Tax=Strongyloides stercoralis TaxID=6248 RepID=A0A0K0DYR0_STRER